MGDKSAIEWTDATWNPVTGCAKVSQGCKFCYAKREWARLSANQQSVYYGRKFEDVRLHPERLTQPMMWGRPRRIFVNSMSDLFHEAVPTEFIDQVMGIASICGQHQFQILTKRPERALEYFTTNPTARDAAWNTIGCARLIDHGAPESRIVEIHARKHVDGYPPRNVQIGVSVEDQETAEERVPILVQVPARIRFLSIEPMLGPIDFAGMWVEHIDQRFHDNVLERIHWMIVGGESGPGARPMAAGWVRSIRDQCAALDVPFFFKQWGEWAPADQLADPDARRLGCRSAEAGGENVWRFGKKAAGRLLDGRTHDGMPASL